MKSRVDPFYAVGNTEVQPTAMQIGRKEDGGFAGFDPAPRNGLVLYWEGAVVALM